MTLTNRQKNTWYTLPNQNLATFMRDAGFDLAVFQGYSNEVQEEAKRRAINAAVKSMADEFEEQTSSSLAEITCGVYVIRLAGGFSIRYRNDHSPIIYIGEGNVAGRVKSHYHTKLFDFMASLNGANFDFLVCEPWKSHHRQGDFHEQIEHQLLSEFVEKFGGLSERYSFPLMNKFQDPTSSLILMEHGGKNR